MQRDKLSLEAAKVRLDSQIDIEEKLKKADFIIKNTNLMPILGKNVLK